MPLGVCATSGWNCTAYSPRSGSSIAAIGITSVCAPTRNPSGSRTTASPWLIHTCSVGLHVGEQHARAIDGRASSGRTRAARSPRPRRRAPAPSAGARSRCRAPAPPGRTPAGRGCGAPSSYTDAGPPDRMMPAGRILPDLAGSGCRGGRSRSRRGTRAPAARSAARTAPPDRRPGRAAGARASSRSSVAHPHALRRLVGLALGLDGRRDHQLRLLELLHVGVAGRRHARGERAEQVERAVVLVRGPDQDLLERRDLLRLDARAARKRWGGTSPSPSGSRGRAPRTRASSGEPIITASAPQAIALAMSPPVRIPPSAITWQ